MKDGTLGEMIYGRWYIRRDGLWEMVHQEGWFMRDGTLGEMFMEDGTLGDMVYEMDHQERWLMGRCNIRRDGLWKDGTLREMVYGKWYFRKDGLWEIVQQNRWFMEDVTLGEMVYDRLVYQERWHRGRGMAEGLLRGEVCMYTLHRRYIRNDCL